jgi:hypothetical protein
VKTEAAAFLTKSSPAAEAASPTRGAVRIRRLRALLGALAFCAGCGGRAAWQMIDVGDAQISVSRCGLDIMYAVSPLRTSVGGQVTLHAAIASDGGPPGTLSWQAPRGRIDTTTLDTAFTCLVGGRQALSLAIETATCQDRIAIAVTCVAPLCGNARIDPGEACDPPNGTSCVDGCVLPCGNGLPDPGEACDPPDGMTCAPGCKLPK